jgi:hypothetical protein
MTDTTQGAKGAVLEEVLRAYFLRAGFFVVRGVPFRFADEDLTDVDLWLYERPTGASRRVQICDVKYKQRPKAVERIFWTSGLAGALEVDGAYVATTTFSRPCPKDLVPHRRFGRLRVSAGLQSLRLATTLTRKPHALQVGSLTWRQR